jgi:hypothetical protein
MIEPNFNWVTKNLKNSDIGPRDAPNAVAWNVLKFVRAAPENRAAFLLICGLIWPPKHQPAWATPGQFPDLTDDELDERFQEEWDLVVSYCEGRDTALTAQPA